MASGKAQIEKVRKEESQIGRDDDWDDSALIAAYDKAMNKAKVEVAKKKNIPYKASTRNDANSKKKQKWNVGDNCLATFSDDGLCYEAVINEIDESNDTCVVVFVGYGNEEEVSLSSLTPSLGRSNVEKQKECAKSFEEPNGDYDDAESSSFSEEEYSRRNRVESNKPAFQDVQHPKEPIPFHRCFANRHPHHYNMAPSAACPPPPPPPAMPTPPPWLLDRTGAEDDKLYSMLLAWYMSGYHTGYYVGTRQNQSSPSHLRNMYNYYGH